MIASWLGRKSCLVVAWTSPRGEVQAAVKTEAILDLLGQHPRVQASVDEGYRGLASAFPGQVHAPTT
jgi:hypothetical protein